MYIHSLFIRNLRSFGSAMLSLRHPDMGLPSSPSAVPQFPNVTLLLGSNGAGKTTVLRAVALSTLAPVLKSGSGYVPYALVRRTGGHKPADAIVIARVVLHQEDDPDSQARDATGLSTVKMEARLAPTRGFTDRFTRALHPRFLAERMYDEDTPGFLVLGYGATRRVDPSPISPEANARERVLRYRRVAGLFEEHVTLMPLSAWLPRWKTRSPRHHAEVLELMNRLLPDAELLEEPTEGEYLFRRAGAVLPFPALSDGYRAFVSWVGDVLYHLCLGCPPDRKLVDLRGIVLVDEVDLHLHPEWQRHVVPTLSRVLPNLQFILTSHSPLVVGTLSSHNVRILKEDTLPAGERVTQVETVDEELYGLSADQILTSESFGLESSRDERFFERLKQAAVDAREGGAEAALRFMRMVGGGAAAEPSSRPEKPRPGVKKKLSVKRSAKTSAKVSTPSKKRTAPARKPRRQRGKPR